jgi:hypothetical protein
MEIILATANLNHVEAVHAQNKIGSRVSKNPNEEAGTALVHALGGIRIQLTPTKFETRKSQMQIHDSGA